MSRVSADVDLQELVASNVLDTYFYGGVKGRNDYEVLRLEGEWFSLALDLNADTAFGLVKFGDDVAKPPVEVGSYLE